MLLLESRLKVIAARPTLTAFQVDVACHSSSWVDHTTARQADIYIYIYIEDLSHAAPHARLQPVYMARINRISRAAKAAATLPLATRNVIWYAKYC